MLPEFKQHGFDNDQTLHSKAYTTVFLSSRVYPRKWVSGGCKHYIIYIYISYILFHLAIVEVLYLVSYKAHETITSQSSSLIQSSVKKMLKHVRLFHGEIRHVVNTQVSAELVYVPLLITIKHIQYLYGQIFELFKIFKITPCQCSFTCCMFTVTFFQTYGA